MTTNSILHDYIAKELGVTSQVLIDQCYKLLGTHESKLTNEEQLEQLSLIIGDKKAAMLVEYFNSLYL